MQVLGISGDTVEAQKAFAAKANVSIPLLADAHRNVISMVGSGNPQFGGLSNRWTYVIDKEGIIRIIDKQVNAASHGKDLADKINF